MVYVVVVYDMEADRTHKMLKFLRRYLTHVQNSVLEGDVTEGDLEKIRSGVDDLLKPGESTIIYQISSEKLVDRSVFGDDPAADDQFL
ncbi:MULTISPECIES: CRISPR-associated endonuclease Cas2 [Halomicrobium]|uniref:CRISPR-associated endoribonuclease Cas2 n=2 Tax=Halomicrobium mukohataei TaxID=57705 RepID=C7P0F2_HALMD|nr:MULTISPECIES: CRISPR-associated endonuclease Cas2 [Halomicrobium]ACV48944.1 CRISPR-associated protein Cas2 [Halomicrobium mukohataei DSM 12286]NLV11157.1 CRISPR-associated endonuclease Cas2 [Halomicrobium mukohataei]QCD64368.1 CRISPR-associated endonuclease Cas2 [Halomicrobium mukohataei]QFR19174.1 CRISPR-associated endonuclease Cas2 [Halomicrobium sp. ZPS1]